MGPKWSWPPWVLNAKDPQIEVYVEDEDTGRGRWVNAEPQSRVVGKDGRDAFLCAEYEWDDDFFVQDFGPHHVRRRGHKETIMAMFDRTANGVDSGEDDSKDSKPVRPGLGRNRRKDSGAGMT